MHVMWLTWLLFYTRVWRHCSLNHQIDLCRFWILVAACWLLWAMVCGHRWCSCQKSCRRSSWQISATTMWRGKSTISSTDIRMWPWTLPNGGICGYTVWSVGNWCYGSHPGWCENCSHVLAPDLLRLSPSTRPEQPSSFDIFSYNY
jgi:hypothetical protein